MPRPLEPVKAGSDSARGQAKVLAQAAWSEGIGTVEDDGQGLHIRGVQPLAVSKSMDQAVDLPVQAPQLHGKRMKVRFTVPVRNTAGLSHTRIRHPTSV
ncbi:hypothetical protein Sxan_22450 [Streptomyces xanthophaeus]|uniref:Uncharacterized protein n=1 Tax=Streptomyces xanthophaeus TaxID=67385 RepID=A0A919GY90_9ACTN|nr:hypothetical protein Sxan_22450 [Streptomyces xanthophaeus]